MANKRAEKRIDPHQRHVQGSGWIKVHRGIMNDELYFADRFTKLQAWLDLLLLAEYKSAGSRFFIRGTAVMVHRGQVAISQETLSKRWQWSRGTVIRFLNFLVKTGKIEQEKSSIINKISIVKWDEYQTDGTPGSTDTRTTGGTYPKKQNNIEKKSASNVIQNQPNNPIATYPGYYHIH